jgi:hypothetical protein
VKDVEVWATLPALSVTLRYTVWDPLVNDKTLLYPVTVAQVTPLVLISVLAMP